MQYEKPKIETIHKEEHSDREISLWLDEYDDIFSDFDPRSYADRNISEDFMDEMRKISQEMSGNIGFIRLLLPEKNRNTSNEELIIKRLHKHLLHSYHDHASEIRSLKIKSIVLVAVAMMLMVLATYLSSVNPANFVRRALFVLTEPAGWFLMWTGLETLFNISRKQMPDVRFFKKVARSRIHFASIESGK